MMIMNTRGLSGIIARVRSIFRAKQDLPKEPRKKVQLQMKLISQKFKTQLEALDLALDDPNLYPSTKKLGQSLFQNAMRFEELQLEKINYARLQALPSSLIEVSDFSLWVKHEMTNLTEEIFHFLSTIE
ncbi:MAG: hypothetical protein GPJ54_05215 [Candidatus Heimdallarchaeota archaeon]|nr:hypothetical protein [Candidatus Heimdallarchaeota archaeon]